MTQGSGDGYAEGYVIASVVRLLDSYVDTVWPASCTSALCNVCVSDLIVSTTKKSTMGIRAIVADPEVPM